MPSFVRPRALLLRAHINSNIVDVIIGDTICHPDDMNGTSPASYISSLAPTPVPSDKEADAGGINQYVTIVINFKQLRLVARYVGVGLSFRQMEQLMLETKEQEKHWIHLRECCQ